MEENPRPKMGIGEQRLSPIKFLIDRKEFKQALAELRELRNQMRLNELNDESEDFYYLSSVILQGCGYYKEAYLSAKRALDLLKNTSRIEKFAQTQFVLGTIYVNMGDLKKGEQELRDAMACFRRLDDKKGIIQVFIELAHVLFVKSEYSKAIEYLNECTAYCDELGDKIAKAKVSANLARIHIRAGNWKLAETYLKVSTKTHEESGNKLTVCNGLLSLGYVWCQQRDFGKAKKCYKRSLDLVRENNYPRQSAIYHEYAGELEFAQGNYEKAKKHYLEAIGMGEKIADGSAIISQSYRLFAELQIAERQYDEALSSCEKALTVATSLGERIEIGAIHRALGQIYTAKKQKDKATENFEKSISILEQIGAKFELGKAYLEAGKSDCFDFHDRIHYLRRAKDVFKDLDSEYHKGLVQRAISELFFENGEHEKAGLFLKDAEKTFNKLNDKKELSSVLSFKKILEKELGKSERIIDDKSKYTFSNIITQNYKMQEIIEIAKRIRNSDLPVLLEGETGTGKDRLAETIHYESPRRNKKFVAVECKTIETLLEKTLFGNVEGAYTDAKKSSPGLFQEADGGTLYLDEIAEITESTQVKLLRATEDKEVYPVGGTKPQKVNVRIIASTSRNLAERVSKGLFRKDLYHRLNGFHFNLPPLRERKEDIPLLIEHLLKENGLSEHASKALRNPEFIEKLLGRHWPGNVRQLESVIKKLDALSEGDNGIDPHFLEETMNELSDERVIEEEAGPLEEQVAELWKKRIKRALEQSGGNIKKAAGLLGISKATLYRKIDLYNLK
jgi:DNA-binding NtrC family response regulator/Tfp pilus assembly protein PilF